MTKGASPGSTRSVERITPPSPLRNVLGMANDDAPGTGVLSGRCRRWQALQLAKPSATPSLVGTQRRAEIVPSGYGPAPRCVIAARSRAIAMTFGSNVRSATASKKTRSPARTQSASVRSVRGSMRG